MSTIKKDGFDCITFHKLFGLGIGQKVENTEKFIKLMIINVLFLVKFTCMILKNCKLYIDLI